VPHGGRRPRVKQLTMDRRRDEQGPVKVMSEVNLAAQDRMVHRARVRDDDHLRLGSDALSRVSSALVLMGYGTRWARNRSTVSWKFRPKSSATFPRKRRPRAQSSQKAFRVSRVFRGSPSPLDSHGI
jgi:hypothetical protein